MARSETLAITLIRPAGAAMPKAASPALRNCDAFVTKSLMRSPTVVCLPSRERITSATIFAACALASAVVARSLPSIADFFSNASAVLLVQ
ncbi:hypothetical protein [Halosaccharopolyspora lacisalsi]|uniref:hypothetical protein n=1 Tax=Halosaccharopolyspora lacisalsi TaxID=1000566 RepID=UPI002E2BA937|nr:hypothetical protein [Halosaccharopolyspora lacisalsi]